jgi:hypothetical protein
MNCKTRLVALMIICMVALPWSGSTAAKLIEDLYSARVDVSSQASQQRQQAIRAAFDQVIIKVTGQSALLEHQAVQSARRNVNDYLLQYGYQRQGSQQQLEATFDGRKLRQLLADNELPYWGSRRPELLLWIAHEQDNNRRQLIGSGDESIFTQQLRTFARAAGIPIQLPLLDLTDAMTVSPTDVWGRFTQPVAKASRRYASDGYLMARITRLENPENPDQTYRLDWSVDVESRRLNGVVYAQSEDWLAEPFVNDLLQQLAKTYSVVSSDQQELIEVALEVQQLQRWQDVLVLEQFLSSVASVESVRLQQYSTERAQFTVVVRGSEDHLLQTIQLDGRLVSQDVSPFIEPKRQQQSVYRWVAN